MATSVKRCRRNGSMGMSLSPQGRRVGKSAEGARGLAPPSFRTSLSFLRFRVGKVLSGVFPFPCVWLACRGKGVDPSRLRPLLEPRAVSASRIYWHHVGPPASAVRRLAVLRTGPPVASCKEVANLVAAFVAHDSQTDDILSMSVDTCFRRRGQCLCCGAFGSSCVQEGRRLAAAFSAVPATGPERY